MFFDSLLGCFHDWHVYTSKEMNWSKIHVCLKCGEVNDPLGNYRRRRDARDARAEELMAGREHIFKKA